MDRTKPINETVFRVDTPGMFRLFEEITCSIDQTLDNTLHPADNGDGTHTIYVRDGDIACYGRRLYAPHWNARPEDYGCGCGHGKDEPDWVTCIEFDHREHVDAWFATHRESYTECRYHGGDERAWHLSVPDKIMAEEIAAEWGAQYGAVPVGRNVRQPEPPPTPQQKADATRRINSLRNSNPYTAAQAAQALGVTTAEFEGAASRARMLRDVYSGGEIICPARALTGPIGDAAMRAMVQAAVDSGTTPFGLI
jgi:hypothetical protein